jgi:hypothetical protein
MPAYPTTGYMTAELCLNGHVITGDIENEPEKTSKFCPACGAETVRTCPKCSAALRGDHVYLGTITWMTENLPKYCHSCGAAFPWTIAKIAAAKEHAAEIEGLDETDRKQLQEAIDDLAADGARTDLAASRFKRLMKKAGVAVGGGFYKVVVDVASDAAKKLILG